MSDDNIISGKLKEDLEYVRKGYPVNKHSFGSLKVFAADSKRYLGRNLSDYELIELGDAQKLIKEKDFDSSLHPAMSKLFALNGVALPTFDSFKHFTTEWDYIKDIAETVDLGVIRPEKEALRNIKLIRKSPENNEFKDISQRKVDLYTLDINEPKAKIKGKLVARKKKDSSGDLKFLQEYTAIRFPGKGELEKSGVFDSKAKFSYLQRVYFDKCMDYTHDALYSGKDVYQFFSNKYEETSSKEEKSIILASMGLFFVDYIAFKFISDVDTIKKLDRGLRHELGDFMSRLEYRTKDYLSLGIKDESIVHVFNGNYDRTSLEGRLQPTTRYVNAELGANAHPKYKDKTEKEVTESLMLESEELLPIFVNLCVQSQHSSPSDVLNSHAKYLPRHELLDAYYNYDESAGLYISKSQ
ncbi:MAG: hypothetical protein PF569_05095 [Candidatus Woesearchaeota archaeon]|jgi:hypothetical protein|nr:hypothetical protein [Candidatus Woesearchaeota archaeon]